VSTDPASWTTDLDRPGDGPDIVAADPRRLGPRGRRALAVAVAAVVLIGAAGWYADGRRRDHEFDQLVGCASKAEAARAAAERRITAMASYVRPSLAVFEAPDRQLYPLIAHEAAVGRPDVESAARGCTNVHVLAIHGQLSRARSDYLRYLSAESGRLADIEADGSHGFDDTDALQALRTSAFAALAAAAPTDSARRRLTAVARVDR
jgi:hypothetical protein